MSVFGGSTFNESHIIWAINKLKELPIKVIMKYGIIFIKYLK